MARGHHRSEAHQGPDCMDWFAAAADVENEFDCLVSLQARPDGPDRGEVTVMAYREVNGVKLGLARQTLAYPNSRIRSYWPTAYLLLHRVSEALHAMAYAPNRKFPHRQD